ncbi:MAG: hypothetical protein QXM68_01480 [Candidatus Aenigmatarchaeota archaeon]|nr:hypothetical protein [Candidatus Aenigmarchaeota archaeon]
MVYSDNVITTNRKGEKEIRNLLDKGVFVKYDYRNPVNFQKMENGKFKLILKGEKEREEYYVIPTKNKDRFLMLKTKPKRTFVWNQFSGKEEEV